MLFLFPFWGGEGDKDAIVFFWMVDLSAVLILQEQILALERTALLVIIIGDVMIPIAPFLLLE